MKVTDQLINARVTPRFTYEYDEDLKNVQTQMYPNGLEPARMNATIAASYDDYDLMAGWFRGIDLSGYNLPISVSIAKDMGGADSGTGGCTRRDDDPGGLTRLNLLPLSFRCRSYRMKRNDRDLSEQRLALTIFKFFSRLQQKLLIPLVLNSVVAIVFFGIQDKDVVTVTNTATVTNSNSNSHTRTLLCSGK